MPSENVTQGRTSSGTDTRNYDRIARSYDATVALFTGGRNLATRLAQIDDFAPRERVLYVGVGTAEDALEAARRGMRVTCVDISENMLEKARWRFARAQLPAGFVCADIMTYTPAEPFDVVVANFFLNVFTPPVMKQVLTRLASFVRPEGKLAIADFAPPRGGWLLRGIHLTYHHVSLVSYWIMGLVPLHPIYVYAEHYPQLGLALRSTRQFRIFWIGPWMFQTTLAIKEKSRSDVAHGLSGMHVGNTSAQEPSPSQIHGAPAKTHRSFEQKPPT